MGGGAYRIGGGVSPPTLLYKVEPEYSEEARKAKFQGTVVLAVVVDENGNPRDMKVHSPAGTGVRSEGHRSGRKVEVHAR